MFTVKNNRVMLSDAVYRIGKKVVQFILPAVGTFYYTMAKIWNWPNVEEVLGSLTATTTFLGACLGISSRQYDASGAAFEGQLKVSPSEETGAPRVTALAFDGKAEDLIGKNSITFKVKHEPLEQPVMPPEDAAEVADETPRKRKRHIHGAEELDA